MLGEFVKSAVCRRTLTPTPALRPGPRPRRWRSKAHAPVARKPCFLAPRERGLPQASPRCLASANNPAAARSSGCNWLSTPTCCSASA
ncbi:hypothetical protein XcodCFBP4690_07985 [Xanthomonas codiaei]|uniref:Uncharacterized protein n=1 Tax=Xanthomonas codiaei TaxID=56463 RepID=A0A2S7CTG2_9XANT|nr:hypothetical protein XcodCFBP4690_07985 [Xanthomonas codiaei]